MSRASRHSARLLAVVVPVSVVGIGLYLAATAWFVHTDPSVTTLIGVAAFLAASMLAERFPVPVEGADANGVSLGFVFAVAALVLFGWAAATFVYVTAPTVTALLDRKPLIRTVYNAGVFGIVGTLAGSILHLVNGQGPAAVLLEVTLTAAVLYSANLLLVTAAISASGSQVGYGRLIRSNIHGTILPFTLMASTALMLVVLWQRTPYLFAALAGPLAAISLYQRSSHRALSAVRLSLTDPLTGLGNHRHFHERFEQAIADAREQGATLSLCLLDVDDFKAINDQYGHPAGDGVLSKVAARLRSDGEAFRLGGDEFALLLPAIGEPLALATAQSIVARLGAADVSPGGGLTISAGVATFPQHGRDRDGLIRSADGALYWAKEQGKNQVRPARDAADLASVDGVGDQAARIRAAASLARVVDSRHADSGNHSERVALFAGRIAKQLGLPEDQVELTRLAGSLHDLGKLAIPEELLRKPAALTREERRLLQRHPQIGYRMLASLGVEPIADWILHQGERWDGTGYPEGLSGDSIPLGSRIVFVADAFDAMTSTRAYRPALLREDAVRELERCAGSQFDPEVVDAFIASVQPPSLVAV
ncbi:MAG TPA: HD domain-containing phosphohydrolase [Gaiellaceae bacterium]|nr:HD domain-containing phosphohydrolase [Gaiellaceae bacterium]